MTLETVESGKGLGGAETKGDAVKREIKKMVALPEKIKIEQFAKGAHLANLKDLSGAPTEDEKDAEIYVVGNDWFLKTRLFTYNGFSNKKVTISKVWTSPEVPGLIVKILKDDGLSLKGITETLYRVNKP